MEEEGDKAELPRRLGRERENRSEKMANGRRETEVGEK